MWPVSPVRLPWLALAIAGAIAHSSSVSAGDRALAVSPGAERGAPAVGGACPTFSWALADDAESYRLVVLDMAEPERPKPVLEKSFARGIGSWTPSGAECLLAGGTYAWTLRALDRADQTIGSEAAWSAPLRFQVPVLPSAEELAAALAVIERWQAAGETMGTAGRPVRGLPAEARGVGGERAAHGLESRAPRVLAVSGNSAVRGENAVTTGANYGVTGISSSTAGAGLVGINVSSGPDLILDGVANGEADTIFTQSGIDRPSGAAQTFNIQNSGAGAMTLQVDGVNLDTAISLIKWSRLFDVPAGFADGIDNDTTYTAGNQLQLAGTQFNVVEGPGSGLDADTLDGAHGTSFQTRVIGICAVGQAMQGVNADGSVVCSEMLVPPRITTVDDPANNVGTWTSLAIGTDGFPVISYRDVTGGDLKVAKCNDAACTGHNETITTVDSFYNVGESTSIAVGTDGFPVISYFDGSAGTLKVAKCNDAACTGNNETITTVDDPVNAVGTFTSLAIGFDGFPVIGYRDVTAGNLKVAKCNDAACAGNNETITTVDSSANDVGYYISLAIGTDGFPVISYRDSSASNLKVAKCTNGSCSASTITTVDSAYGVGGGSSLAIGTDGFPVISYYDNAAAVLKVVKCNDPACAGNNESITTVDNFPSATVSNFTSLAIGTDGFPVMSYYDVSASNLKVAKCNDAACLGNKTITTVDAPGSRVGYYISLAIGTDGFPVMSYSDLDAGSLKVAKCRSPSCSY